VNPNDPGNPEGPTIPSSDLRINRGTIFVSGVITLFVTVAIVVGIGYLTATIKTQVATFQAAPTRTVTTSQGTSLPIAPEQKQEGSRPSSTPWTRAAAQAYATEQANRAARLRQEEHTRQLEQTRRTNQQIIDERTRAQQQRQQGSHRPAEQEFTVPLGAFTRVTLSGKSYRVAIHDDGPDEVRVLVDYRPVARFQKRNGFDARDLETLILSNGSSHLYYVNEISDHVGHCNLRIRDE